ncbi:MAG: hypothetical protein JKY52_09125 [Flavobacteriales bacterium]|nr:hypothetical protein [Flavobacteriales bacterium]
MSGKAIKETGGFNIYMATLSDQKALADMYLFEIENDAKIELDVFVNSFEFSSSTDMTLRSIGSSLEDEVMNYLIAEIEEHFLDKVQPALDSYWEDQRGE